MKDWRSSLQPYKYLIWFVIVLFGANALWKAMISGDEQGWSNVTCCGKDVTSLFDAAAEHIAYIVYRLALLLGFEVEWTNFTHLRFPAGIAPNGLTQQYFSLDVVWGCTAIKQAFIFFMVMLIPSGRYTSLTSDTASTMATVNRLFARRLLRWGGWILLGFSSIYAFNIFRILMVGLLCSQHPTWFNILHAYIFKYLFYAMIFALWEKR